MSRPIGRPRADKPKYCLDKPSRRAFVTLAGKRRYLGRHGTQESRDLYDRLIGEWIAQGRPRNLIEAGDTGPNVTQIIVAFWAAARTLYPNSKCREGKHPTGELSNYFDALKPLRRLYGTTPAKEFGPIRLKALREEYVRMGWSRGVVNKQISRIRRVFAWAVEEELLAGEIYYRLCAVKPLKLGRTQAPETEPTQPVSRPLVNAATSRVSRQIKAMIELQQLTAMRPGEVCAMRLKEIDRSAALWAYKPLKHKTAHHGHERIINLGKRAQEILTPFLTLDPERYLFSPAEAETDRREKLHQQRTTPEEFGNVPGSNCHAKPRRKPGERYTVDSYRRAIQRACQRAIDPPATLERHRVKTGPKRSRRETLQEWRSRLGPELWEELLEWQRRQRWHPHQLRHTAGTELRKEFGLEAAQVMLGHKTLKVTEIYAQKNLDAAKKIVEQIG